MEKMNERPGKQGAGLLAPSQALALLNKRALSKAPVLQEGEEVVPEKQLDGYGFQLAGQACWLPRTDTLALLDDGRICAVPGAPRLLAGFLIHGGELMPVWDPGADAGQQVEGRRRRREQGNDNQIRTLIVRQGGVTCGLRILGMPRPVRLPESLWAQPAAPTGPTAGWIRGYAHAKEGVWACVDVSALAAVAGAL
ncbi:MAG: hypothetical protein D6758_05275 [Gammaproteobacteria bacterium]|nr:MAG: hypothetical protein D6758_05275 [Gammaproteobacteria bacterium]